MLTNQVIYNTRLLLAISYCWLSRPALATNSESIYTVGKAEREAGTGAAVAMRQNNAVKGTPGQSGENPAVKAKSRKRGIRVHAEQEGVDEPYFLRAALSSDLRIIRNKQESAETGAARYDLSGEAAYILKKQFEAGGGLTFSEETSKYGDVAYTTREINPYLLGRYNIFEVDKEELVPYLGLTLGYCSQSGDQGGVKVEASGMSFTVFGGVHYFVDSNVALSGEIGYGYRKLSGKDMPDVTETQISPLRIGFSVFI